MLVCLLARLRTVSFGPPVLARARIYKVERRKMNQLLAIWTLGIDVAKAKLDCALRTPEGKYKNKVVSNKREGWEQLRQWLAKQNVGQLHVCMEATNVYWEDCAEFLTD